MRISALVLAAGRSRRFGEANKLLAELEGTTVLAHTLDAVTAAGFDKVFVVTGPDHDALAPGLARFPVQIVRCPDDCDGIGYSIAAGIAAVTTDVDGVAILPADMPLIRSSTLRTLMRTFESHGACAIVHAATRNGEQRNPVIWPATFYTELASLTGDKGAKSLIVGAIAVHIADEGELMDVDDPAMLEHARTILRARRVPS